MHLRPDRRLEYAGRIQNGSNLIRIISAAAQIAGECHAHIVLAGC